MAGAPLPLAGFRVLDATDELGVYATRLLVELGAEVVRLEPPGGDPLRRYPPFADADGRVSLYHLHFNAGKRSLTLDLTRPAAHDWLSRLLTTCHALVESGPVRGLLSTRIGLTAMWAARPDLVVVSVTPFGLHGSYRERTGGDLVVAAHSGLLWLNGRPDGPPHRPGGEQAAHMAGLLAANAALLGLFHQRRTGQGCHLDVPATFAASLATLQTANANYVTWHGRIPTRRGMGLPPFRHIFPAADGWVALTALPGQWPNLVRLLCDHAAAADLADPAYRDDAYRYERSEHINAVIEAFTSRYPKQYLFKVAQEAGVACAPVNTAADLAADPFLHGRGWFRPVRHADLGRVLRYPGPPFRLGNPGGAGAALHPAPDQGADNHAVWVDELGMDAATFAALCATEVR